MIKPNRILGITLILVLQSCLFGSGLVEREITDDYWLFANNTLDEMSIWLLAERHSAQLIVPETVFAVGDNGDFIIAKSHPKDPDVGINKYVTNYHIIKVGERSTLRSPNLTLQQFEYERKKLNLPNDLDFDIVFEELE